MAERRMIAKSIIKNDVFYDLPLETQALYFHICLEADDDGFVGNVNSIIRSVGASKKDLDALLESRYLLAFPTNSCICVKHWKIHNYIPSDRYRKTTYQEEFALLDIDYKNGYTENETYKKVCEEMGMSTENVYKKCIHSIGKDRLIKDRLDKVKYIYNTSNEGCMSQSDSLSNDTPNNSSVKTPKTHAFVIPTLEEVTKYVVDNNYSVDPQQFIDFYDSKGWMVGKNKMKNWKTALSGWNSRNKNTSFSNNPKYEVPTPAWYEEHKKEVLENQEKQRTLFDESLDTEQIKNAAKELFG